MENNKDLAEGYVELADSFIYEKNYEKAEKFLLKAKQLSPSKKIDDTLAKLAFLSRKSADNRVRFSLFNDQNKDEADRCLELTEQFISKGDYEKAQELLTKAQKLYPSERADSISFKLLLLMKKSRDQTSEYVNFSRDINKEESAKCVEFAERFMAEKNYEKAEKFLLKAKRLYPTKEIDSLLAKLYILYNQQKAKSENIINRDEADRCIELAEQCIKNKNYEKAKKFLLKAKRLYPTSVIEESLTKLEELLCKQRNEEQEKFTNEMNRDEAEKCVQMAQTLISEKNYEKAEKFLLKAKKLYPSAKIVSLLEELAELPKYQRKKSEAYFFRIDINREEAERCVEMATRYISEKNYEKAKRLLLKAKKLFPMDVIDKKLVELDLILKDGSDKENIPSQSQKYYTKDELEIVNRVLACKFNDYYEILQVSRPAIDSEVKKAYRKLALKVHPDKNSAPGAEEAFKRIKHAFQILSCTNTKSDKKEEKETKKKSRKDHFNSSFSGFENSNDKSQKDRFNSTFSGYENNKTSEDNDFNSSFGQQKKSKSDYDSWFEKNSKPQPDSHNSNFWEQPKSDDYEQSFKENQSQNDNYNSFFNKYWNQHSDSFYEKFNDTEFHDDPFQPEDSLNVSNKFVSKSIILGTILLTMVVLTGKYVIYDNIVHYMRNFNSSNFHFSEPMNFTTFPMYFKSGNIIPSDESYGYQLLKTLSVQCLYLCRECVMKFLVLLRLALIAFYEFLYEIEWQSYLDFISSPIFDFVKLSCNSVTKMYDEYLGRFFSLISFDNNVFLMSVRAIEWKNYALAFVDFFYLNARNMFNFVENLGCRMIQTYSPYFSMNLGIFDFFYANICSGYHFVTGMDWIYLWNKARDFSVGCVPWELLNRFRGDYLNWNFVFSCLKIGFCNTISSISYVSQSIFTFLKEIK